MTPMITLESGRQVRLLSFHVRETYAGWMEGVHRRSRNAHYLEEGLKCIERMWGVRKHVLIPPVVVPGPAAVGVSAEDPVEELPEWMHFAWLESSPICAEFCGSELVVVWLGQLRSDVSLEGLVSGAVRGVRWEVEAVDFDY